MVKYDDVELTTNPYALLRATYGDEFLVDGKKFVFESMGQKCFLTKVVKQIDDVLEWWDNDPHDNSDQSPWQHIRDERGVALMTRKELISVLECKTYTIY